MKALVLSGGGSKGSYQIGVWKALKKLNYKFDIVTGTSIGAINGAMIVQNTYTKAINIWKKINLKVLFGEDINNNLTDFELYKIYSKNFLKYGGMNTKDLEKLIKSSINLQKFYSSKINFGLTTYNITTKKALELQKKDIKKNKLHDYLMASASCFPAFQTKNIEGEKHIDGGYHDNLPINLAIDMGATEIIAIDLSAPGIKKTPKEKVKITYIKPKNKLTNFLNFNQKDIIKNMHYGYNDTMKIFKQLEGNKYTFKKNQLEKNQQLYQDTYIYIVNKTLKYKTVISKFEAITKLNINLDNEESQKMFYKILLRIMESVGQSFELDETKIYTHQTFNKHIKNKLNKYIKNNQTNLKKEVELYMLIKEENYTSLRKQALLNPIDTLKAIYLYTICEA